MVEAMRKIEKVYIHCSASEWGNVEEIRQWHTLPKPKGRGWKDIGYHYLCTNHFPYWRNLKDCVPIKRYDGKIWKGRPDEVMGAHVKGDNAHSLGICIVGNEAFTSNQVDGAALLAAQLCLRYDLSAKDVWGHYEFWTKAGEPAKKSCPNINMETFRSHVAGRICILKEENA